MEPELINSPTIKPQEIDYYKTYKVHLHIIGYIMLLVSLLLYAACEYFEVKDNLFMIFILHYFISVTYTLVLISQGAYGIRKSWRKENIGKSVIAANLYLIAAYALNRELQVFENAVDWLCFYILITSFTTLSFQYFNRLPSWINKIQYVLLGSAIVLYLYLSVYVAKFYFIGIIGLIGLGIGIHILVPITLVVACIFVFIHNRTNKAYHWVGLGMALPICFAIAFTFIWNARISKIEKFVNQSVMYKQAELPLWVTVAQHIQNDWISQRILKSDLVYTFSNNTFSNWDFMPKSASWDEIRKHDPLVFIASLNSKCSLPDEDRVKILKATSNGRHKANERLWSGDNLTTSYIVSDIDIYTDLRLSYTEKYLNIKNNSEKGRWWGNTQEAIYTFYLPEGSVVTSLSLWINGKEEKGILTSKQKATKAYTTIVGVEQRDPSVVHWQEGNTVTVRVFPCTTDEERKFKIGITSPLQEVEGQTVYKSIIFEGPNAAHAQETKRIHFIGSRKDITLPNDFVKDKKGGFISEQKYDPDFSLTFKSPLITPNHFTFDGFTYSIEDYNPSYKSFSCNDIFMDINDTWKDRELDDLKVLLDQHKIFVYDDEERIELNADNWSDVTEEMQHRNFTVFPFHHIKDTDHTLIVTKGKTLSPHLSDFKDSEFAKTNSKFFTTGKKVNVFNLQGGTSTYISSLKELRGLEFANGSTLELIDLLSDKKFITADESNEKVILHDAKMIITKVASVDTLPNNNAPDHLARLFAYNDIMRKVGVNYLNNEFINDELVDEAATAYVVSPVSSLIVLETQEDYKRFGIHDKTNSLHNAAKQSSGAVPEPHEWALIVLFLVFVLYLRLRPARLNTI